ncbi:RNA-binding protein 7-like [Scleropages formosus]|uniref:RNA binding motif protein 7 n=1 Tax=Scleropages formosus TaxID=113540 RepID=A0A0N8JY12_SCLFO|nr:RNA-binding protein 7 [Scleropages formosus]KPP65249.1 RNA-binding protein 7-like [Scleropages formosus]
MGIADEADRTLFVGNLDPQVTEELLFELFLQAGPLIKVKIPKDNDGRSKQFGFINFKHEVSVPYGMQLLNGTRLFGRPLKIQFRSGSSHINQEGNSPGQSQSPSPCNTPTHRGGRYDRTMDQMGSPSHSPPQPLLRSFSHTDNLQRQAVMNTWQMHTNGSFYGNYGQGPGGDHGYGGSWQQESSPSSRGLWHGYQHGNNRDHYSREQRHSEQGSERHHRSQRGDHYYHDERSGGGGRSRDYPERHRDGARAARWRRY